MRIHRCNTILLIVPLAAVLACGMAAASTPSSSPQANDDKTSTAVTYKQGSLRSRIALDAYLIANKGHATPFDALPSMARRRFLDSLVFGRNGLGGFGTAELETELTRDEVIRILTLFDLSEYASGVKSRHPDVPPAWRKKQADAGKVETGFDELYRLNRPDASNRLELRQRFNVLFADLFRQPDIIRNIPEHDLLYLMRSIELTASDSPTPETIKDLRAVVAAMNESGIAQAQDFRSVYDALLRLHRFDEAKRYAVEHPNADLAELPRMVDPFHDSAPPISVWRTSNDNTSLVRTALDIGPTQILVTAGCHFSEDAAEDISNDPMLGPAFAAHAHWLLLPPGQEDQDAVREWNQRFPAAQAMQIYDRKEWTLLPPGWAMPTFLVVRNGKVLERITGWPRKPAANRQLLIDALKRADLLKP
ncbi:hypothetical protein [Thermomonas sp.]|uniref:hypothetical protein n=1 Tax=Thermomonas sp. TaxID=1971895 RepID=UPI00248999C1|nr:hypothetical protein [Thermomonas sp.]MDI1252960.1 hypothetical protein [Thermomonas sp.]